MRKVVQFVLKLVDVCMVVAPAAFCVIAYRENIS